MSKLFIKSYKPIALLFTLVLFTAACSPEVSPNFEDDPLVSELSKKLHEFKTLNSDDYNNIVANISEAKLIGDQLAVKYGGIEKVDEFLSEMASKDKKSKYVRSEIAFGEHDGDPCTRNLNGTTYWDKCSFWESVRAYIGSLGCSGESTAEQVYDCVQSSICKHCKD